MAPKSCFVLASAVLVLLSAAVVRCDGGLESSERSAEGGGLGGIIGGIGKGLNSNFRELLGGIGGSGGSGGGGGEGKGELLEKKLAEKEASKEGFLGIKGPVELVKLLLNPLELIKQIAGFFKLEKLGLIELIGKGATFGLEVALQPALLSIKIIEKVFVPDACKLKFVCELGRPAAVLKAGIPKFSSGFLDGSSSLKAFSDGILGHECEHLYPCGGELKLKKEFELLKSNKLGDVKGGGLSEVFGHGDGQSDHYGGEQPSYAA